MDKFTELSGEYQGYEAFLRDALPGASLGDEPLCHYMAAVLKVWGSNVLYAPDYRRLLSLIAGVPYTIEQVVTAMSCCGDAERKLAIPAYFDRLIERDLQQGSQLVPACIARLNDLLVASAMINGDFTVEEANAISLILSALTRRAAYAGVSVDAPDNHARITQRKEDSYLQNDALTQAARRPENPWASPGPLRRAPPSPDASGAAPAQPPAPADPPAPAQPAQPAAPADPPAPAQQEEPETLESLLAQLDGLVGLQGVKQDVHSLMNFIKVTRIRRQRGKRVPTMSYHLVFTGNPGTGKTTVARLVGKLYYHMGILPQGQLVEADRSALVAGYLGQTAIKTQQMIQQAMGGVLFIDEAYALAGETDDSYGREAIETLLKAMEDHRDELVVIVAGYTDLMHRFIASNPGLSSRFSKYFAFEDYTGDELLAIFRRFCQGSGYALEEEAAALLLQRFDALYRIRDERFGNARMARNLFEKAINAQADRLAALAHISDADLELIRTQDIIAAMGGDPT